MKAFTAGVDMDGLKKVEDIKTMICYILKNVNEPLTKELINDILLEDYVLANYFEINQAIHELIKAGTILRENRNGQIILTLREDLRSTVDFLENTLPRTVREKAINTSVKLFTRMRRERENKVIVEKLDKGYNVTFTLFDVDTEFMKLTVYVSDEYQVEQIKNNYLNDPAKLYSGIITSLTT